MRPVKEMSARWYIRRLWQQGACGLTITINAFYRWIMCHLAAPHYLGLLNTEIAFSHLIAHRGREKQIADIALVLDSEDIHIVSYVIKKLEAAGLICAHRAGKEKMVAISEARLDACQHYGQLHMLSGTCKQAARAVASF